SRALTPVHGMWIGESLSRMELLTLLSFIRQGHRFHLWVYDKINTPIPEGVILEDATEILPRSAVFKRREVDPQSGVGAGSYGAPFSDLFRYKLLHDKGGYWADMDVTCLKPFPADTPYLFRSHRIGVVGNIMKCPRGSRLMGQTFEQTLRLADEGSPWLLPNQILSENLKRLGLSKYIRGNFCNADSWPDVVLPFIENDYAPPADWFAIHWLNEVWRTLSQDAGLFKGRPMLKYTVDKNRPKQGTTLARLYESHGLNSSRQTNADGVSANGSRHAASGRLASRNHINVLVPTLAIGGAERIVVDTLTALGESRSNPPEGSKAATLFVMEASEPAYSSQIQNVETVQLASRTNGGACELVAGRVLRSGTPTLFVHLGDESLLNRLWSLGVRTIPVVHNTAAGWTAKAQTYNHPNVPFVVAVCERVAVELGEHGCLKRIIVVRHEIARNGGGEESGDDRIGSRKRVRARYGISDDTLLVGMVGQFKRQKNYPKAVQVLAELRKTLPAKLMILGPWDHSWGDGRQVFAETYRAACDLDVVPDVISVGAAIEVEEYYSAFDVMLSTSSYEGLSISMMEADGQGCPVVSSAAGGAAEIISDRITLLPIDASPQEYAGAIALASKNAPVFPAPPEEAGLIPELWNLLGQFGDPHTYRLDSKISACITGCLVGSSVHAKTVQKLAAAGAVQCVLTTGSIDSANERTLRSQDVHIYDVSPMETTVSAVGAILRTIQELGISTVYIAGLDCKLRLLLAKVLPPEAVVMYDSDSIEPLFQKMGEVRNLARRIAFDESDYFRRISPWPGPAR
ncbi:MAG TPA: glycosyltransferase, partial [Blastocatellia bacterium]|nr:glycosyltransferase [Blastocatellia bacterium]